MQKLFKDICEQDIRIAESFPYAREISRPGLDNVLEWCKSELVDNWKWQLVDVSSAQQPGRYIFYFDSDRDCCAFSLKWC